MIIVDDGSTDKTFEVASQFAKYDSRIKVFTQKNIGPFRLGETYNFALQQSKGKYTAILEGDDVWTEQNKLNIQVQALENNSDTVLCFGKAYTVSRDRSKKLQMDGWEKWWKNTRTYPFDNRGKIDLISYMSHIPPALTVIIRNETLNEIGGFLSFSGFLAIDVPTWITLSLYGKFIFVDYYLGEWRMYPEQVTKRFQVNIISSLYHFYTVFYQTHKDDIGNCTEQDIHQYYQVLSVVAYSRSGRYKLIRKEWRSARKDYLKSIFSFGLHNSVWKLRSIIGLLMSFFHLDVEWIAKLLGNNTYKY